MTSTIDFSSIGIDDLVQAGGVKWSMFPGKIGAFTAEMDFGTAPAVTQALHAAVDQGLLGYLPKALSDAMAEATAQWQLDMYGWDISPDQVKAIPDVIKGLEIAIQFYSKPGSPLIVPTPAYMPFLNIVPEAMGREVIQVPAQMNDGRYEMDLEALDRAYKAGGHLLILCNPWNPVGRVLSREELLGISEVVTRNGGRVYADEVHAPIVYAGSTHVPYASISTDAAAHTVTATSASKSWNLAGVKAAQFILSNAEDEKTWEAMGPLPTHGASTLGVIANTAAYSSGRQWLDRVVAYNDANRHALADLLAEYLPEVRYTAPEGTYIAWLDARELGLGERPSEFFRDEAGVVLTDGIDCGVQGSGFVRFIFATPQPIMEQAIRQMAAALDMRR